MKNVGINSQYILSSSRHPDFDEKSLHALVEDTNPQVALEVTLSFQQNIQASQTQIESALIENDFETIWKAMHKLAGTAELVGYTHFGRYSRLLSHKIKDAPNFKIYTMDVHDYLKKVKSVDENIKLALLALRQEKW